MNQNQNQNEQHHLYGPSSLKRRELCPGSAREERLLPDIPNEFAAQGTKLHAAIACKLDGVEMPALTPEESETVENMACFFDERMPGGGKVHTEVGLAYSYYGETLYTGTADVLIERPDDSATLIDWKTGRRAVEEASDNLQGAAYALAAMQQQGHKAIEVIFYNPVIHQVTSHTYTVDGGVEVARQIVAIIEACKDPNAPCKPGEEQCRYCKAREHGTCQAYLASVKKGVVIATAEPRAVIAQLADADLAMMIDSLAPASKFLESLQRELKTRIEFRGAPVANWTIKTTSGGREAADINQLYAAISGDVNNEEFVSCCSLSVSKVEKLFAFKKKRLGEYKTEKEAKELFAEKTNGLIVEKSPRNQLVKMGEK